MTVEQRVRPAGGPRTLDEDGREGVGYLGSCRAPDGDSQWVGAAVGEDEAVGGDVAEKKELFDGGVVSDKERGRFIVTCRVVLAV